MHRFFLPPEAFKGRVVAFEGPVAHQIANVLRLREGARVVALDNSGWEMEVELDLVTRDRAGGHIVRRTLNAAEPTVKITIYQALLKSDHFELVLQKGTELGVVAFVPLVTARTVLGTAGEVDSTKVRRWQRIVIEAAEQSGRGRLPVLQPAMLFESACEGARGFSVIPWEAERTVCLRHALRERFSGETRAGRPGERPFSVNLFVGPEGGFTAEEVDLARRHDIVPVSLGPRILRAETAAIVAAAAVLYEAGELGG